MEDSARVCHAGFCIFTRTVIGTYVAAASHQVIATFRKYVARAYRSDRSLDISELLESLVRG